MDDNEDEVEAFCVRLLNTRTEEEWGDICDEVKARYDGYPKWWYPRVLLGGIYSIACRQWEGSE